MKDPSEAMQAAYTAKLEAASAVTTLLGGAGRILDKTPDKPAYPFIRVGEDLVVDISNGCFDAWEFSTTLHIFSRHPQWPRKEVKRISNAAVAALATEGGLPSPAGFKISQARVTQARSFYDDKLTAHGVTTILYRVNDGA